MFNPVGVAGHRCAVGHGFHPRLLTLKPFGLSNPDCSGVPVSVQVLHDLSGIAFNPSGGLRLVAIGMILNVQPRRSCGTWVRSWPRVSPAVIDIEALRAFKPRLLRVTGISAGLARLIRHCIQPQRGFKACRHRNDPDCSTPSELRDMGAQLATGFTRGY